MTLDTLIPTAADFGSEAAFLASVLERYNEEYEPVSDFTRMFLEGARADLRLDLPRVAGSPLSDPIYDASIADVVTEPQWRYLVSRRQLAVIYDWLDEGSGSANRERHKRYLAEYDAALRGIPTVLVRGTGTIARTVTVRL